MYWVQQGEYGLLLATLDLLFSKQHMLAHYWVVLLEAKLELDRGRVLLGRVEKSGAQDYERAFRYMETVHKMHKRVLMPA